MKSKKTPNPLRSSARRRAVRTPELVAVEELGQAIGRLCAASPEFRADFTAGFTLAMKADALGRVRDAAAAAADLEAKGGAFATTFLDAKLSSAALAYFGAKAKS
jgi:hypothetical protein